MKKSIFILMFCCFVVLVIESFILFVLMNKNDKNDIPLTNEQIMKKATVCHKKGKKIQVVYDDEFQVYAVKCTETGFTGDGRRKR